MGVAFGGALPEDSSGFSFNTKFQLGPMLGLKVRWTTEITHADAPGLFVDDANQYCCSNARKAGS